MLTAVLLYPESPAAHHPIRIVERNTLELRTDISDSSSASKMGRQE
ncbi:hypothetical protein HanPI659440_Chr00c05g0713491 [Helianthus annuus]|nr:hypothetical protein HanPI659440_Chr00c05g0713491 [Helianthus annuus]